jgi:hypothetical protein
LNWDVSLNKNWIGSSLVKCHGEKSRSRNHSRFETSSLRSSLNTLSYFWTQIQLQSSSKIWSDKDNFWQWNIRKCKIVFFCFLYHKRIHQNGARTQSLFLFCSVTKSWKNQSTSHTLFIEIGNLMVFNASTVPIFSRNRF